MHEKYSALFTSSVLKYDEGMSLKWDYKLNPRLTKKRESLRTALVVFYCWDKDHDQN